MVSDRVSFWSAIAYRKLSAVSSVQHHPFVAQMSYSDFTLAKVKKDFDLITSEWHSREFIARTPV
jgi:hypothetical protein